MSHLCTNSTLCIISSCIALLALAVTRSTDNVPWWSWWSWWCLTCKNYNIRLRIDGCQELESSLGHFHLSPHFICAVLVWFINHPSFVQKKPDHFITDWSYVILVSNPDAWSCSPSCCLPWRSNHLCHMRRKRWRARSTNTTSWTACVLGGS